MVATVKQSKPAKRAKGSNPQPNLEVSNQLAQLELEYIFNESFRSSSADELLTPAPLAQTVTNATWKPGRDMPAHLVRMCERKLLTPAEEQAYFRRMNYARFKADRLRRQLSPSRVKPELVAEIQELLRIAESDRNEIIRANLRLVVSIAKKFATPQVVFDDLLSEGIETLVRAVEKFDCDRGFRFSTYATQAVRRTLGRFLQNKQRDRQRFLSSESSVLAEKEAEENQGISPKRFDELRTTLRRLLNKLDPRERSILKQRFGLDHTDDVRTLQSLAHDMGVCKERVRQLEIRAISKLRVLAEKVQLRLPEDE